MARPKTPSRRQQVRGQLGLDFTNALFFGDNLEVLRKHLPDESVDLIYLDPPFNSKKSYNLLFKQQDGTKTAAQVKAFDDTWHWSLDSARVFDEVVSGGGPPSDMIRGLRAILGTNDVLAYIVMMTPRLLELHRVLKSTGSLYLHCDPTASHYIKVMLDAIFAPENFANEITWKRTNAHNDPNQFGRISDTLLFYRKSSQFTWNTPYVPYRPEYLTSHFKPDNDGRHFQLVTLDAPRHGAGSPGLIYDWRGKMPPASRTWAVRRELMEAYEREGRIAYTKTGTPRLIQYADQMPGAAVQNIWTDIPPINSQAAERLGYPTQKPLALLERIITTSSNDGDVVLDPFCGCGTAIDAAQKLGRRWIGIDVTEVAIDVVRKRLEQQFGKVDYVFDAEPGTREEAAALARLDKHKFQRWACEKIGVLKPGGKGADRGIDGKLIDTFDDGSSWTAIVSVKGGKNNVRDLRDLSGTVTRAGAYIGVLLTLNPPTAAMKREVADGGFTETGQARLQVLTVDDLFAGKRPDLPAKAAPAPKQERRLRAV